MDDTLIMATGLVVERNEAVTPFPHAAPPELLEELSARATACLQREGSPGEWEIHALDQLSLAMRAYLVERGLMTPDFAGRSGAGRLVGVFHGGRASLETNGASHFRLLCSRPYDHLMEMWDVVDGLDDVLEAEFAWAFHDRRGYLSADPEVCGTGLHVHVTLEIPALMVTGRLGPLAVRLQGQGFTLAPLWESAGGMFQIFNRATSGRNEGELMGAALDTARMVVDRERSARKAVFRENPGRARDYVGRALGVAQQAWVVNMAEGVSLISALQVGGELGITEPVLSPQAAFALMRRIQPGHIVVEEIRAAHGGLEEPVIDEVRARILRDAFADTSAGR